MAAYRRLSEIKTETAKYVARIRQLHSLVQRTIQIDTAEKDMPESPAEVQAIAQNNLDTVDLIRDGLVTDLTAFAYTVGIEAHQHDDGDYTSAAIDVNNGSTKGTITANAGTPFNGFAVGDVVELIDCEDSDSDGEYTVDAKTDTVLTMTAIIGGADNAADTSIVVVLRTR